MYNEIQVQNGCYELQVEPNAKHGIKIINSTRTEIRCDGCGMIGFLNNYRG